MICARGLHSNSIKASDAFVSARLLTLSEMADEVCIIRLRDVRDYTCIIDLRDEVDRECYSYIHMAAHPSDMLIKTIYFDEQPSMNPANASKWVKAMTNKYKSAVMDIANALQAGYFKVGILNQTSQPALAYQILYAFLLKKYLGCEVRARWDLIQHVQNYNLAPFNAFYQHYIIPSLCNTFGFYDAVDEGDDVNLICAD